jgi:hypothetical protein
MPQHTAWQPSFASTPATRSRAQVCSSHQCHAGRLPPNSSSLWHAPLRRLTCVAFFVPEGVVKPDSSDALDGGDYRLGTTAPACQLLKPSVDRTIDKLVRCAGPLELEELAELKQACPLLHAFLARRVAGDGGLEGSVVPLLEALLKVLVSVPVQGIVPVMRAVRHLCVCHYWTP